MGQRAIINTEVFLQDLPGCPPTGLLGEEGKGFYSLMHTFDESRIHLGAPRRSVSPAPAYEYCRRVRHAPETRSESRSASIRRWASGWPTWPPASTPPACSPTARPRLMDAGRHVPAEAAMAKLFASETATWVTWAALQTLGGWGYSREYPGREWSRDARLEELEEGTSDIQRLIVGRGLLRA